MSMSSDFALSILNNKYVLVGLLGSGGFGDVYEAYVPQRSLPCAIKVVSCETEEKRRQVLREGNLLKHYSKTWHFIPDVYDVWSEGQTSYLVMEFIRGDTLQEQMQQSSQPWSADRAITFLRFMLGFLTQVHEAGIVHRDLKPSNIKPHPTRGYILLDFGIAKQFETYTFAKEVGTFEYAPLEQLTQGGSTDQRSDLYSLGVTAYQLLTRQLPRAAYLRDTARHNGEGEILVRPSQLVGGVPPALERTLLALLALDPAGRPANARAALVLLDSPAEDSVIASPTPKRPSSPLTAPQQVAGQAAVLPSAMPTMPLAVSSAAGAPTVVLPRVPPLAAFAGVPPATPTPQQGGRVAVLAAPRLALRARAVAWWRALWRPTPSLPLAFTGLWGIIGGAIGWGAGVGALLSTETRPLLYPVLGALIGATLCAGARFLALPRGHAEEPVVATAGLYVGAMALIGALVGGLYTIFDPALSRQDGTVMLGAAFAPLLGAVAALLLRAFRERSVEPIRRIGTGAVFVTICAALVGILIGGVIGCLFWLFPSGSANNLLSDCIVPGALGGGAIGAALGLYLGSATLLLRDP